jgi:hypothetical protein
MRHALPHSSEAFTRIELIVVILITCVLVSMFLPPTYRVKAKAPRITCINNLKPIGFAYRMWANDHGNRFPASQSATDGGWCEALTNSGQGFMCWTNYSILAYELGSLTKLLACPSDERKPAEAFSNFVSNINLSYFVGVSADLSQPQSLLSGDRNLGNENMPVAAYGFSPKDGQGNDVDIQTNSQAGPTCWSSKMHSNGSSAGAGNILLSDGSVQQVTSGSFRKNWQPVGGLTTNWPAGQLPLSPSYRVLFP